MLRITKIIRDSLRGQIWQESKGIVVILNITSACNLRCKHCYISAGKPSPDELSLEEIESIASELKDMNTRAVIISGGEPLIRKDVFKIAQIMKKNKISTQLSSNGTLINEKNIKDIKENFDYVGISLDGPPEVHDFFRGQDGSFKKILNSILLCKKEGINLGIRFSISEYTAGKNNLEFIFNLAEEIEVNKVYISYVVNYGYAKYLPKINYTKLRESTNFIIEKAFEYVENNKNIEIVTGNNEYDAVILFEEFSKRYPEKKDIMRANLKVWGGNACGERIINIDNKGNIKPDPFFPIAVGNVREGKISEQLEKSDIIKFLRERPRKIKYCIGCEFVDICNGGSRSRAINTYGKIDMPDPNCYLIYEKWRLPELYA
jgi:radical SAM protein with 4Fe4S-binding SPASM domain